MNPKECGCKHHISQISSNDNDFHLHEEIEQLRQHLAEREGHIVLLETKILSETHTSQQANQQNGPINKLHDELETWQDKYRRLYESHRKVQRVNQNLENKLLKIVDLCETEKNALSKEVANLSRKLGETESLLGKLTKDNERYKNDVSLAIQLLRCKQSNYVEQKLDSLPADVQTQVYSHLNQKIRREVPKYEMKSIKVPIATFPPTAMVYSVPKTTQKNVEPENPQFDNERIDIVSASIMAKVLEEREKDRSLKKHCETCKCDEKNNRKIDTKATQTDFETNLLVDNSNQLKMESYQMNVAKVEPNNFLNSEIYRASPYSCQDGPKNILLENAHEGNFSPLLYTENNSYDNLSSNVENLNLEDQKVDTSSISSSDFCDDVLENLNNSNAHSSFNNSIEPLNTTINIENREKYAQMEENVKKFLLGESEFFNRFTNP